MEMGLWSRAARKIIEISVISGMMKIGKNYGRTCGRQNIIIVRADGRKIAKTTD